MPEERRPFVEYRRPFEQASEALENPRIFTGNCAQLVNPCSTHGIHNANPHGWQSTKPPPLTA